MDNKKEIVQSIINKVTEQICNEYCKFPELVRSEVKDIDMAEDLLMKSYCDSCPLQRMT